MGRRLVSIPNDVCELKPNRASMSVLSRVRQVVTTSEEPDTVIECRQCGTTFDTVPDQCSACGSDDIVATALN